MEKDENGNVTLSELGKPKRYMTEFNAEGKSIFETTFDESIAPIAYPGALSYEIYTSTQHPIDMAGNADLKAMKELAPATSIHREGATMARIVDFLPGAPLMMHRTVSVDFGVLVSGELELVLDSGETRVMKPGDTVVQRGTNHAWRNTHPTESARALFVMAPSVPLVINGEELHEHMEFPEN
jgi:quercetin dioxygenase-like cupin family protein